MNQWNASVVVIGEASTRWPEAVPLLSKGKQPEAVEIVNAAAAVAEIRFRRRFHMSYGPIHPVRNPRRARARLGAPLAAAMSGASFEVEDLL